jgi:hypothetical protein
LNETHLSRRAFLARANTAARTSLVVLSVPMILSASAQAQAARAAGAGFTALSATEAGAVHFMDAVLGTSHGDLLPALREGLFELQARAAETYGSASFAALTEPQQDRLLTEIEESAFFATLRFLTVAGTFSLPAYGGNRDGIGWKLIGFDHRHVWTSPYGFYDADYAAKGA